MRIIRIISFAVLAMFLEGKTIAQNQTIPVTQYKTTSLIFKNSIKSVDRGSQDILAQKAKGVENVLQVKAAKSGFQETNITVITAEGTLHQFTVNYSAQPESMTFSVDQAGKIIDTKASHVSFGTDLTDPEMETLSRQVAHSSTNTVLKRSRNNSVSLVLNAIAIKRNHMFYSMRIVNDSNIGYDIDGIRLYVRDKSKMKRTASQELEMKPVYTYGSETSIAGATSRSIVFVLEKFTIPDAKRFVIEVTEKDGGRHLSLEIKNSRIAKSKRI